MSNYGYGALLGAAEFRFLARPFALGKPDKQFVPIHVSDHKSRRTPVQDGCLDALFVEVPPEWLDLVMIEPDKDTAVSFRTLGQTLQKHAMSP